MSSKNISVAQMIEEAKIKKSKNLDLRYIDEDIDEIPKELFQLIDIEELTLSRKFNLNSIPNEILNLKKLWKLEISGNFQEFPEILIKLPNLTDLILDSESLKIIPKKLEKWTNLTYLNLRGCRQIELVESLPPNLTYIYIDGTTLKQIPEVLYSLKNLGKIVLQKFKLTTFPKRVLELNKLYALFLGKNGLKSVPKEIVNLTQLTSLWLEGNKIKTFPKVICDLTHLKELNLSCNLIGVLPSEICNLQNLEYLDLGSNNFKEYPNETFSLKNLKELKFGNYHFRNSKFNNSFTELPKEVVFIENLKILDLFGIDIDNVPKEILKEGLEAIKNYFRSKLEAVDEEFLYEAKMVIVGRGDVGKSVLTKKLTVPNYSLAKSETTKGINILKNPWEFKMKGLKKSTSFRFNIWDFGGQEKYDATHQLFITNRSVYLFLTEARSESNYQDVFYWLNTISLLSYNSPVIVILSKFDERKKVLPESIYTDQFPNIVDFIDVSCADGFEYSIENLKKTIAKAVTLLPQTKLTLSNHWIDIRKKLEELSQLQDYIDYSEYLEICENNKLDKHRADFLSEYLNDLGVIIHHKYDLLLKKNCFYKH